MKALFKLAPVTDDSFFETAPVRYRYEMHLAASADEVWASLVADRPQAWCRAMNARYSSPRRFGVGTTREVGTLANLLKLRERYFIWDEENRRHAFYVEQASLPLFAQFAEDFQVTPAAEGCRFVWRFAIRGPRGLGPLFKMSGPLNKKLMLDGLIRDTERHFKTLGPTLVST